MRVQVAGSPAMGDESLGKRGYDRGDLVVEPHKVLSAKTGTETSAFFYPKEGDRVVGFNYVSFRIPPNWLDIDPPTVHRFSYTSYPLFTQPHKMRTLACLCVSRSP